jgi:hypothetical protein
MSRDELVLLKNPCIHEKAKLSRREFLERTSHVKAVRTSFNRSNNLQSIQFFEF